MTQSHGDVFEALPGSPTGYGWTQDQSCHLYACYLNLWDTFLSGQNNIVFDANMDGYITGYPDGGEPFLMRIANGNAGFVRYPYGLGQVILYTGYTDYAYRFGGNFKDAAAMIRDLVTSYIVTDTIPEFYQDSLVALNATLYYPEYENNGPANRADIVTYYPNRDSLRLDQVVLSPPMLPGDTQVVSLASIDAPCSLGIYPLAFTLFNDTIAVSNEEYSNAFAVKCSIEVGNYNVGDFQLWATVESESAFYRMPIEFTINVRNNTEDTLIGNIYIGRLGGWPPQLIPEDSIKYVTLLPDTVSLFAWDTVSDNSRSYFFCLKDSTAYTTLAQFSKFIEVTFPRARAFVECDSSAYQHNDTVHYSVSFKTNYEGIDSFTIAIIYHGWNQEDTVFELRDTIKYLKDSIVTYASSLFLPQDFSPGYYSIKAETYWRGRKCAFGTAYFYLHGPRIWLTLDKDKEITGSDTAFLTVHMDPESYIWSDNNLDYYISSYKHPTEDTLLSYHIHYDTLRHNDTLSMPFALEIDSLTLDRTYYFFRYNFESFDTINGYYLFDNDIAISMLGNFWGRHWGDTLYWKINLKNTGDFATPIQLITEFEKPSGNYYDSLIVDMQLEMDTTFYYTTTVDSGTPTGYYVVTARVRFGKDYKELKRGCRVVEPTQPNIVLALDTIYYQTGDTAQVILFNTGELEGEVNLTDIGLYDIDWNYFPLDTAHFVIPGGGFAFYEFVVPEVMSGPYHLNIHGIVAVYNTIIDERFGLQIKGIEADYALMTSKEIYLPYEEVKPQLICDNGAYQLDATAYLSITPHGLYPGDTSFIPGGDDYLWPIDDWNSPGCTLSNGKVTLLGWDKFYWADWWSMRPGYGERGGEILSEDQYIKVMLDARNSGKERGDEPIKCVAMADKDGALYVALTTDLRRKIIGPYPEWTDVFELSDIASINHFVIDNDYFYIVDADSECLYKVSQNSGSVSKQWRITNPGGIGIYNGYLYVVDKTNHAVLKTDLSGDSIIVFGTDSLVEPTDLAIDSNGNIYVADVNKAKVYIFDPTGNIIGTRTNNRFSRIAVDAKGYLYGADIDNLCLAKFDETGTLLEYYFWTLPDEIAVSDTLIHMTLIHSDYYDDYITTEVVTNYGRNKGYTTTEQAWIPGLKYITDFHPYEYANAGHIDWFFKVWCPADTLLPEVWYPIDSLHLVDCEDYDNYTPVFKAEISNPSDGFCPEIERFDLSYVSRRSGDVIWSGMESLSVAPLDSVLFEQNAGVIQDTGEFILWGDIILNNQQRVPSLNPHVFYIDEALLALGITTDREIYYPGEEVIVSSYIGNNSDSTYTDIVYQLIKETNIVLDTLITTLSPQSVCTLTTTLTDSNSFMLHGQVFRTGLDTTSALAFVEMETPEISFWTVSPCTVDHQPFEVSTEIANWWSREVEIVFKTTCGSNEFFDTLMLYSSETKTIEHSFTIQNDDILWSELVQPFEMSDSFPIRFGMKLNVESDSVITSNPSVIIPYYAVNIGDYDCMFDLHLEVVDSSGLIYDSVTYTEVLPVSDTLTGEFGVTLDYGEYSFTWDALIHTSSIVLAQGSQVIKVFQPDIVTVDSIILLAECDSIGRLIFEVLVTNHSAQPFYGAIELSSNIIQEELPLDLNAFASDTIEFLCSVVPDQGYQSMTARILQNGEPMVEFTDSVYCQPMIILDSLPPMVTINIGDSARIYISTQNQGTAHGQKDMEFVFTEFIEEERVVDLNPGQQTIDTFTFYVPEDLEEKMYYASVWLDNTEYILPIYIQGYKVAVDAHLNQPYFKPGDTIILSLNISNQNERNLPGFCVGNYDEENITQDFLLSGFKRCVDISNIEFIKATADSGVYVSPVLWLDGFDSLKVIPEGTGVFNFYSRVVEADSVHYSLWYSDSILPEHAEHMQFKIQFQDTISKLERVHIRMYDSLAFRDTIIEQFAPVDIENQFSFIFDPIMNILFYGIYTETGRGLWLNTIYVFEENDTCNIVTDKQTYDMGDTVFVSVQSPYAGQFSWRVEFDPFGSLSDSLWLDSLNNEFNFVLPPELASGQYTINFDFAINGDTASIFTSSHPFNVRGYLVSVYECRLDTNQYQPDDSMFIRFKMHSSHSIDLITKLKFMQNYQPYGTISDTIAVNAGYNVIDYATVVPELNRGPAVLNYSFSKDSITLFYSSEAFMVQIPDTIPPVAQFIEIPENTYDPNVDHIVKITATDETSIDDTLYYHIGYAQYSLSHYTQSGDTLVYKIPSQPRGTNVAYYITLQDSFDNLTRLPDIDYNQFWILNPLPPSSCKIDTVSQNIRISWDCPTENIIYHSGYPSESKTDSIAVRFTPQYTPAELKNINIFIEKTVPDTTTLNINFYSVEQGMPGSKIYPSKAVKIVEEGPHWIEVPIDSIALNGEIFIAFHGDNLKFFGDADESVYRTLIKDNEWETNALFGNMLAHAEFSYEIDSLFYQVLREDTSWFTVIGDSLDSGPFIDSMVSGENTYRYLVKAHYMEPDLNGISPILTQTYDYTPPTFGDSVTIVEYEQGYYIGCEISDGIGIAVDSMVYNGLSIGHDSIVNNFYWYSIPTSGQMISYYFIVQDSAGNLARNPDTGYFYIIPHIPEGFSGHISKDTTWSTDILIKGDVWVDSGVTLTINPGVSVKFIPNFDDEHAGIDTTRAEFIIKGVMKLLGNDSMYVTFTSNSATPQKNDWYGIRFECKDSCIDVSYLRLEYAKLGLFYELNRFFKIRYDVISNCERGIVSRSNFTQISETQLINCDQGAVINDGYLNFVERCEFLGNSTGLVLNGKDQDRRFTSLPYYRLAQDTGAIGALSNDFVSEDIDSRKWQLVLVYNNMFSCNDTGVIFMDCAVSMVNKNIFTGNAMAVYITENAWPILGIRLTGMNLFQVPIDSLHCYAIYNNTTHYIFAEGNWWNSNNEDSIAAMIWDYYDDNALGIVDFKPFRETEVADICQGGTQSSSDDIIEEIGFEVPTIIHQGNIVVKYQTPTGRQATISIYDITGRLVKKVTLRGSSGVKQHSINCADLSGGLYFIWFKTNTFSEIKKVILVK
ncbi:MAG TPA: T9SS type A sorting domain-containing protein [candidate division WOR-3 bacterium]|uniref:T9SS type A sorting domain-containing protein n=1 Tax=candidate division WOR-3 bacterium TaxID=2052148 RepID=A0A9C9EKH1_UNCW3|nr:T9SS type A sorting domain-containing protein [candidate division WOR-3 bacterium]